VASLAEGQGLTVAGSKDREPVVAAGCLVTAVDGSEPTVLLVHRPKYDDWSLPKGKRDEGEHILATAVREVHEETGLRVALRRPLPSREYLAEGLPKVVHYWHAEVLADDGFVPGKEVDEIAWVPLADAVDRATHPLDAALIAHALQPSGTPFLVLRHGKAVKRAAWDGEDLERPMEPAGHEQAAALVPLLAAYGVGRVHSSAARRCVTTVEPYAEHIAAPVVLEPALTEDGFELDPTAGLDRGSGLLAETDRSGVATVLCGHRPVMPPLLAHLLEGSDVVGPTDTMPTGSFVVVHVNDGTVLAAEQHVVD
jgi:8-oxo-(d)GTP phosphatase